MTNDEYMAMTSGEPNYNATPTPTAPTPSNAGLAAAEPPAPPTYGEDLSRTYGDVGEPPPFAPGAPSAPAEPRRGLVPAAVHGVADLARHPGATLSKLGHAAAKMDTPTILSILSGLGAMATAPTRSLGVALGAGLQAGTAAYTGVQTQQAELRKTAAEAEGVRAQANLARIQGLKSGYVFVADELNGKTINNGVRGNWMPSGDVMGASGAARTGVAPTANPNFSIPQTSVNSARNAYFQADPANQGKMVDGQRAVYDLGIASANQHRQTVEYASNISKLGRGALQAGTLNQVFAPVAALAQSLLDKLPKDTKEGLIRTLGLGAAGITPTEIVEKIINNKSLVQQAGLGERAVASIQRAYDGMANPGMRFETAAKLSADMMTDAQRDLDRAAFMRDFAERNEASGAPNRNAFDPQVVELEFARQAGAIDYAREGEVLNGIIQKQGEFDALVSALQGVHGAARADLMKAIDQEYGVRGISRYFIGAI